MPLTNDNHTQVSNEFIDSHMRNLNDAAVRVFLVITRKTKGWHKETDSISLSQMVELTGLSLNGVRQGVADLGKAGLIRVDRKGDGRATITTFTLNYQNNGAATEPITKNNGSVSEPISQNNGAATEPTKEIREINKESKETSSVSESRRTKVDSKEVKQITDYYQELFVEDYGAKPTWDGKVMKLVHADLSRLGCSILGKLIQLFFEDPGDFVERNGTGKGYPVFHSQIDHLLERRARMMKGCA